VSDWPILETEQERRDRLAARLALALNRKGYAKFPRDGWEGWPPERLVEARRDLWDTLQACADRYGDVEFFEYGGATIVQWASTESGEADT